MTGESGAVGTGALDADDLVRERVSVENWPSLKKVLVHGIEFEHIGHLLPILTNGRDLVIDDVPGLRDGQPVLGRRLNTGLESAAARAGLADVHCLIGFTASTKLRAEVIGRREFEVLTVPERGMVASMVVSVPNSDIEDDPLEECAPQVPAGLSPPEQNVEYFRVGGGRVQGVSAIFGESTMMS